MNEKGAGRATDPRSGIRSEERTGKMSMTKKMFLLVLLTALGALIASGCAPDQAQEPEDV